MASPKTKRRSMTRVRVTGFSPKFFDRATVAGVEGGRCRYCERIFVGSSESDRAGFAHDCSVPTDEVVVIVEQRQGE